MSLQDEFSAAVCSLTPQRIDWLRSFGIPNSVIFDEPLMIGATKVQTFPSGFYELNDDGTPVVVVAAGRPAGPIWDTLDDLIAFRPQDPRRWWRRLGAVQVLGSDNIQPEPVFPLALYETPLSWLLAARAGVCIVDWSFDPEHLLYAGPLEAESTQLKTRLKRRIQQAAIEKFRLP